MKDKRQDEQWNPEADPFNPPRGCRRRTTCEREDGCYAYLMTFDNCAAVDRALARRAKEENDA